MSGGCDIVKSDLTSYDDAIVRILEQAQALKETERVGLYEAQGRILAQGIISPVDVPPADNSAMDGYAVRSSEISAGARLRISQRIPAGVFGKPLEPGSVARIFTGAPVPEGADAIVMQELVDADGEAATFKGPSTPGEDIRKAGEDIKQNSEILAPGTRLRPQELGLMASVGVAEAEVFRRLKVAIFFTGDELVEPGNTLAPGQIYNSNQYSLYALLQALGCEIINLGIIEDTLEATKLALQQAAQKADLIVTSGGVSVGEEDHVRIAVEQLGELNMWKLKIKPGKPLVLGKIGTADFFGLPGNPVSAFATFCLFVRPFILKTQGYHQAMPQLIDAQANFEWLKPGIRREFLRARISNSDNKVSIYPHQGSGVLSSTCWANGFAVVPENTKVELGDRVKFMPFTELLS